MIGMISANLLVLSLAGGSPIVTFVIVAVLVAVALYYLPLLLPMDGPTWQLIRVVVIICLILYALRLFSVI